MQSQVQTYTARYYHPEGGAPYNIAEHRAPDFRTVRDGVVGLHYGTKLVSDCFCNGTWQLVFEHVNGRQFVVRIT